MSVVYPRYILRIYTALGRWERTEEPFFVEEEREAALESMFEADLEVRLFPSCLPTPCPELQQDLRGSYHARWPESTIAGTPNTRASSWSCV